jgi:hypothetical protein
MIYVLFIGEDREHDFDHKQVLVFDNMQKAILAACKMFLASLNGKSDNAIDDMFIVQRGWGDQNTADQINLKQLSAEDAEFTGRDAASNEKGWLRDWVFRKTVSDMIRNNLSGPNQSWYVQEFGRAAQGAQGAVAAY